MKVADFITIGIYEPYLIERFNSVFRGEGVNEHCEDFPESPVMVEFLKDDDLQSITVCSGNIGFVNTYEKVFRGAQRQQQ